MNENNRIRMLFLSPKALKGSIIKSWLRESFVLVAKNPSPWSLFLALALVNFSIAVVLSSLVFTYGFLGQVLMRFFGTAANCLTLVCAYKLARALSYKESFKTLDFFKTYKLLQNTSFQLTILFFLILDLIFVFIQDNLFPEISTWFQSSQTSFGSLIQELGGKDKAAEYMFNYVAFISLFKFSLYFFTWAILPLFCFYEWNSKDDFKLILKNNFLSVKKNFYLLFKLFFILILLFFLIIFIIVSIFASAATLFLIIFFAFLILYFPFCLTCLLLATKSIFME